MDAERIATIASEYYLEKTPYENAIELDNINTTIQELQKLEEADQMDFTTHHEHRLAIKFVLRLSQVQK